MFRLLSSSSIVGQVEIKKYQKVCSFSGMVVNAVYNLKMENSQNTVFVSHSDCGNEVETDDEALSLADLPVTDKFKKKTSIVKKWNLVIMNACKRFLKSSSHGKKQKFEFSRSNSFADHGAAVICHADELFYEGRLLPLSSNSLHSRSNINRTSSSKNLHSQSSTSSRNSPHSQSSINRTSSSKSLHSQTNTSSSNGLHSQSSINRTSSSKSLHSHTNTSSSNLVSIIRLENDMTSQVMAVAAHRQNAASASSPPLSPRRMFSSSSFRWQHLKGALLSIPPSHSAPFSIDKLRKSQRSYSSSSMSISPPHFSWQFTGGRVTSAKWGESGGTSEGPKKRNSWKIKKSIGNGCRDYDGVLVRSVIG
ncbi:hypothetical protein SUGI_0915330 [Cryptomeria japonica]|nr:hypothetical protein SUGI_0915330 [Cryptomeria japonica]